MTDIPRLRAGIVGGQFWSVWVPVEIKGAEAVETTLEQIDLVKRIAAKYPADFEIALYGRRRAPDPQGRENRLADRHRRRPSDRQFPRGAAADVRPRRALHDVDPRPQYRLGGCRHRRARAPWLDAVRRGGGPRDEPSRHARRFEPRLARHDAGGARGERRAGHVFPFLRARARRSSARCARRHPRGWSRRTAAS